MALNNKSINGIQLCSDETSDKLLVLIETQSKKYKSENYKCLITFSKYKTYIETLVKDKTLFEFKITFLTIGKYFTKTGLYDFEIECTKDEDEITYLYNGDYTTKKEFLKSVLDFKNFQ